MKRLLGLMAVLLIHVLLYGWDGGKPAPGFQAAPWPGGESTFRSYGVDDGLLSAGISALEQDSEGYLWVGTDQGLFRFDGHAFRHLGQDEGLPDAPNVRIWPDPTGGLWVSNSTALFKIEGLKANKWSGTRGLPDSPAWSACRDNRGRAWVACGAKGLFREDAPGSFVRIPLEFAPFRLALAPRQGGVLVCDIRGHCIVLAPDGQPQARWFLDEPGEVELVDALEDAEGCFWMLTRRGLWFKEPQSDQVRAFNHPLVQSGGDSRDLKPDGKGGIWVASVHGLLHIRKKMWTGMTAREGMPTPSASQVLVDSEGSLWYASTGLYRELGKGACNSFTTRQGLPANIIWALCQGAKGEIWAGTDQGLAVKDQDRWRLTPGSDHSAIFSVVALHSEGVLASGRTRVLFYARPGEQRVVQIPLPQAFDPTSSVFRLVVDAHGVVWVYGSAEMGRLAFGANGPRMAEIVKPPEGGYLFESYCSLASADGTLWFATKAGLTRFQQGQWRHWSNAECSAGGGLYGLAEDRDGSLLISDYAHSGLIRLRVEGERLKTLRIYKAEKGELPSDVIYSIHPEESSSRVWLMTDVGAVALHQEGYWTFGRSFGMRNQDTVLNGFLKERSGAYWIANAECLARLDLSDFSWQASLPAPTIEFMKFGDRPEEVLSSRPPMIPARDNSMELSLGFPAFSKAKDVIYEIRIDGLDQAWRKQPLNRLQFLSLPPGEFTLRVRGRVDGRTGPSLTRKFTILPRWYQSAPFRIGAILVLAALIWGAVVWRHRSLHIANEHLEAQVKTRTLELEDAYHRLEMQSLTDPLTGLHNRRFLTMTLPDQIAGIRRTLLQNPTLGAGAIPTNHPLFFLLLDLDHFKHVNDTYGHDAGDAVLRQLAELLRSTARDGDSIIRWGGEEFLIIARQTGAYNPVAFPERIRAAVEAHEFVLPDGQVIHKTTSIGFTPFPLGMRAPMPPWEGAVFLADRALYAAKRSGRNAWVGLLEGPSFDLEALGPEAAKWEIPTLVQHGVLQVSASATEISKDAWL